MSDKPTTRSKPDLYVLARFFDALTRPDVVLTRRKLQAAVSLNYDLFRSYLSDLEARGLITIRKAEKGSDLVVLTSTGRDAARRLLEWIETTLGRDLV